MGKRQIVQDGHMARHVSDGLDRLAGAGFTEASVLVMEMARGGQAGSGRLSARQKLAWLFFSSRVNGG